MFHLNGVHAVSLKENRYAEANLSNYRFWIPSIELGLGVWEGSYKNVNMPWLRWYDKNGNWVLTPTEQARKLAEKEREKTKD